MKEEFELLNSFQKQFLISKVPPPLLRHR